MNQITLIISADAPAQIIERAHAAIDAFSGNFVAASLQNDGQATSGNTLPGPLPTATVEQAAAAQGNVELDAAGMPWDGRIHAGTKNKTQKGEWTKLKGVADAVRDAVTAELRAMYPEPQAAAATASSTPATPTPPVNGVPTPTAVSVPQISIAPKSEYQKLVDYIAQGVASGKLPQEVVDATFAENKTSLAALASNEEHSAAFREAFEGFVASQG